MNLASSVKVGTMSPPLPARIEQPAKVSIAGGRLVSNALPSKQSPARDGPPSARSAWPDEPTALLRTTLSRVSHRLSSTFGRTAMP